MTHEKRCMFRQNQFSHSLFESNINVPNRSTEIPQRATPVMERENSM
jgi:hypothetical protein